MPAAGAASRLRRADAFADLTRDEFKRIRARYVIAADGGSSAIRGQLGIGFGGRTFSERWIVIDTKVIREWPGHDRLRFHCNPARPTVDCPTRWGITAGVPDARRGGRPGPAQRGRHLEDPQPPGHHHRRRRIPGFACYSHHVRFADRWRSTRCSWPVTPPTPCRRGSAGHCAPGCATSPTCAETAGRTVRIASRGGAGHLSGRAASTRQGSEPGGEGRQGHRRPPPPPGRGAPTRLPHREQAARLQRLAARNNRWLPPAHYGSGLLARNGNPAVGWLIPSPG